MSMKYMDGVYTKTMKELRAQRDQRESAAYNRVPMPMVEWSLLLSFGLAATSGLWT